MQTVLCYGDSNTWGCVPLAGGEAPSRFAHEERWPGVLRAQLGPGYWIVEEGLNGRTTIRNDEEEGLHRSGADLLVPTLEAHEPIDVVVVMLGTNDLKSRFEASPGDIAEGAGRLVDVIRESTLGPDASAPRVLLICPPPLGRLSQFAETFAGGAEKSRQLAAAFTEVVRTRNCAYLDAGQHVSTSDIDGIHLDREAHAALGKAVAKAIRA